ncbi:MAG: hypothetical protein JJ942_19350 [Roseitalea sp.]|nr:hypothetical protein [Roseitalea sp.]
MTSNWLLENMAMQSITHTSDDTIDRIGANKIAARAVSLRRFIEAISHRR